MQSRALLNNEIFQSTLLRWINILFYLSSSLCHPFLP